MTVSVCCPGGGSLLADSISQVAPLENHALTDQEWPPQAIRLTSAKLSTLGTPSQDPGFKAG